MRLALGSNYARSPAARAVQRALCWLVAVSLSVAATLGPLPPTPIAFGAATAAVSFDGSARWVQMPSAVSVSGSLTVEAWAKPTALVTGLNGVVSNSSYALALQPIDTGFAVVLRITSGGKIYTATTAPAGPLGLGQWYHLAGTFDGQTLRVFVNGNLLGTPLTIPLAGGIDSSTAPLRVGMLDGSSIHFAGEVDEVRVSDNVRYPTSFFRPVATPFGTDGSTRGLWHFDEGTGSTTADASGNANTGTLMGGVGWASDSPVGGASNPPVITNVATSVVQSTTATITWTTDKPAASQVEYGPSPAFGFRSAKDSSLVTSHSVKLDGLLGHTTYNYQVVSTDAFGNVAIPPSFSSFTTTDPSASPLGEWSAARNWPEVAVHAALLYTGDVIAWDAFEVGGTPSVRLWHPNTETFTQVPNLVSQIFCSGMAALADGRLLVVGGHNGEETGIPDTSIFTPSIDPAGIGTGTWAAGPKMAQARWYPSATELPDGRVLAFSGQITSGRFANQVELYTPATNSWSSLAGVDTSDFATDQYPLSYQLPNGKFFTLAPQSGRSRYVDVAAQTYTQALPDSTQVLNGSAVMYRPGKILFTGGSRALSSETAAEVVDLTQINPAWRPTKPMAIARTFHNMMVLPDGKVLAIGGGDRVDAQFGGTSQLAAESWDPITETWTTLAAERDPREYHSTALLLPDGRVLVAGGGKFGTNPDFYTAEIYSPPYLFKGARPTIASAPAVTTYAENMAIATPDASNISSVVLTGLGAVTHTLDMDQRYVELAFTRSTGGLTAQAPQSASLAPPGYYMLWLVNSSGVPSVAKIVKLGGTSATVLPPVVSVGTPSAGNVFGSNVTVTALATSSVGIHQVQVYLDDQPLGTPLTTAPYAASWDTTRVTNGSHRLLARATDLFGDLGTSTTVTVNVLNIGPPVVTQVAASNVTQTGAVISWTTDESTIGSVQFGTNAAFGSQTPLEPTFGVDHAQILNGLSPDTVYFCDIVATNVIGGTTVSSVFNFRTPPPPPPPPSPSGGGGGKSAPSGGGGGPAPSGGGGGPAPSGGGGGTAPPVGGSASSSLLGPPVPPPAPLAMPTPVAPPPVQVAGVQAATPPAAGPPTLNLTLDWASVTLTLPAITGALTEAAPGSLPAPPAGFQVGAHPFTVALQDTTSGQPVSDLLVPLSLTLRLSSADLAAAGGDPNRLHLALWTGSAWEGLACTTDATNGTLACASSRPGLVAVLITPSTTGPLDFDVPGGHFYKQANGFSGSGDLGFAVVDDDQANMWSEFGRLGGVERVGYPISGRFVFRGFLTQAFQKLVLQWRPETGRAEPVNVFDELSQRGSDPWLATDRETPPASDTTADAGLVWDQVVARHAALLDPYPALRAAFDASPDTIETLGLPLAVHDYGAVVSVRLQRATLQLWKRDTPWAPAGTVVVGNGGDVAKEAGLWPSNATASTAAPSDAPTGAPPAPD